jgi:hypothetical protein
MELFSSAAIELDQSSKNAATESAQTNARTAMHLSPMLEIAVLQFVPKAPLLRLPH